MNREIKFRQWTTLKQFHYFDLQTSRITSSEEHCSPIMQFTGLKDSKGVDIYEGDIVNKYGFKAEGVVTFGTYKRRDYSNHDRQVDHHGWYIKPIPYFQESTGITYNQDVESLVNTQNGVEVIGNIYENPELLEEK